LALYTGVGYYHSSVTEIMLPVEGGNNSLKPRKMRELEKRNMQIDLNKLRHEIKILTQNAAISWDVEKCATVPLLVNWKEKKFANANIIPTYLLKININLCR